MPRRDKTDRRLVTVLFTDIAGSTERAAELGDTQWRRLLDAHNRTMRRLLKRHQGREIDTAGDGFFATFQQPAHAVDCALGMIDALASMGVHIRAGVHMGEVDVLGQKVSGMTVHIGARLMSLASADQVIVSSTVRDLMTGSDLPFADQGVRQLKGVDAEWLVYSVDGRQEDAPQLLLPEPHEPPSRWRRPVALAAAAAVLAVGVLAGVLLTRDGASIRPVKNTVIRIDEAGELVSVVPVGTGPNTMATDGEGLWVANSLDRTVQRIDLDEETAEPAEGGLGNATSITTGGDRVWVGSSLATDDSLVRIDPTQPNSAQNVNIGAPVSDLAFGLDALWATDADGSQLLRLDPTTAEVVRRIRFPEGSGSTGVAISEDAVWVALHDAGQIARVDPETGEFITIPCAVGAPDQVAVGAGFVWVTVGNGDAVIRIDPKTSSPFTIDPVGLDGPAGIAASDQGVWVANSHGSSVVRIDPDGGEILARVAVGSDVSPQAVVATPAGIWVSLIGR